MRIHAALVTLLFVASAQASTVTIATFADPALNATTPLFSHDADTNTLSGGWALDGLTLETASGDYNDATFIMAAAPGTAPGLVGAGQIDFFDDLSNLILTIGFDSGQLNVIGFGATEFLSTNTVTISGPILTNPLIDEGFSFAFANQTPVGTGGSYTATASFTSSATVVPEPASLVLVLVGGIALIRRYRPGHITR